MHHLAAEACVEGEIEEETQSDVQEIFMFTRHQFGQLLYYVYLSLSEKERKINGTYETFKVVTVMAKKTLFMFFKKYVFIFYVILLCSI